MLQTAVSRLRNLWPNAHIDVFTHNLKELSNVCPGAYPLRGSKSFPWVTPVPSLLYRSISAPSAWKYISELEWKAHQKLPFLTRFGLLKKLAKFDRDHDLSPQLNAIRAADLIVATGGGYLTDSFPNKAKRTLGILNLSTWLNKPTVLLGHGLGPLENSELNRKTSVVLPRVTFISLREGKASMPLLTSLKVSPSKVITVGDDAIELAYQVRSDTVGTGIGVNLRVSRYSNVESDAIEKVRSALHEAAIRREAPLIPVPIAHQSGEDDPKAIQSLLRGYDDDSDGGRNLNTPIKVAKQVGGCRVVVTGSYHAGVFALSQGIPVVALAKSQYYQDKFLGLAEQFGTGCEILYLSDEQLKDKLIAAIERAWSAFEVTRTPLLTAAKLQIEQSWAAYKKVYQLFGEGSRQ